MVKNFQCQVYSIYMTSMGVLFYSTLKYQIEVHVRTINFLTTFPSCTGLFHSVRLLFSKFSRNCKIFFYVIYNVSVKIQLFFKSKGENDHENEEKNTFSWCLEKCLTLTT